MKFYIVDSLKRHTSDTLKTRAVLRLYRKWGYINNRELYNLLQEVKK